MDIKQKVIFQAVKQLKAAGAKFIIRAEGMEDISEGGLVLAAPEPERKRKYKVPFGTYHAIYSNPMSSMVVGDIWTFDVPDGIDPDSLRGSVSSHACRIWGNGNSTTSVTKLSNGAYQLQLLRMG